MAKKKPAAVEVTLPAQDALPPSVFDHPVLHAIVNASCGGASKKALVTKFGLPLAYINAVLYEYLEKYDN